MERFFTQSRTVANIKKTYHRLAMQFHPDLGGDTATMQELNAQYLAALQRCDGETITDEQGQKHTYNYRTEREQEIIDFLDKLIGSGALQPDVECWLIGYWVWVQGNTRPVKDILKAVGCSWHGKRACWYWHPAQGRTHYNANASLDDLAAAYGASAVIAKDKDRPDSRIAA